MAIHNNTDIVAALARATKLNSLFGIASSQIVSETPQSACAAPVQSNPSTSTSGGTLANATTFFYVITAVDAHGYESIASNEKSILTGSGSNSNTLFWAAVANAVNYKIYRSTTTTTEHIETTLGNVLTYVDTGTATGAAVYPATAVIGPAVLHTGCNSALNDLARAEAVRLVDLDVSQRQRLI